MITLTDYDRKVYEKELKGFLPKEFIDCHVHVWKKDFPSQGSSNGGSTWTEKVAEELRAEELLESYKIMFPENKVTPLFWVVVHIIFPPVMIMSGISRLSMGFQLSSEQVTI